MRRALHHFDFMCSRTGTYVTKALQVTMERGGSKIPKKCVTYLGMDPNRRAWFSLNSDFRSFINGGVTSDGMKFSFFSLKNNERNTIFTTKSFILRALAATVILFRSKTHPQNAVEPLWEDTRTTESKLHIIPT